MTIRSVDMQVLLPKVSDVARIQQIAHNENNVKQQEQNQMIMHQTARTSQSVNQLSKDEQARLREKEEKEKKEKKYEQKRGNSKNIENTNEVNAKTKQNSGFNLDITV